MRNEASEAYQQATKAAIDPVMEIYARLNTIRLRKSEDPNIIDQNIADLKALAKKTATATTAILFFMPSLCLK
ncbi:hypothetical protein [Phnomibacter ginsenosidimutans]|uniref:hypothetical protein n=1 Tax=Phnomibacter ginsenosidimutans TaxID=2676868 RepID=UPI0018D21FCE|nr:hypothetical protein [Phnomibacter ginsenosidimutans]